MTIKKQIKTVAKHVLPSQVMLLLNSLKKSALIFNYHRVTDCVLDPNKTNYNQTLEVNKASFDRQIRFLSENFQCVDLMTIVDSLVHGKPVHNLVAITLDDGYKDNLTIALPILKKYHIPATIFLTTSLINGDATAWWHELEYIVENTEQIIFTSSEKEHVLVHPTKQQKFETQDVMNAMFKNLPLMGQQNILKQLRDQTGITYSEPELFLNWSDVAVLDKEKLITIGAHSKSHPVLSKLSNEMLIRELVDSKNLLEEKLQHSVDLFAYPFGDSEHADVREFEAAQSVGYTSAFTAQLGRVRASDKNNLHALPRIYMSYNDDDKDILLRLSKIT